MTILWQRQHMAMRCDTLHTKVVRSAASVDEEAAMHLAPVCLLELYRKSSAARLCLPLGLGHTLELRIKLERLSDREQRPQYVKLRADTCKLEQREPTQGP